METAPAPPPPCLDLDRALQLVTHDRWLLGGLSEGKLKVLVDSCPERERPFRRTRALSHLARRCLHERRPIAVSALAAAEPAPEEPTDWEVDWPALLYTPVGMPGRRPVGLMLLGSRGDHWYDQDEIDYVAALGVALTSMVLAVAGPLHRLRGSELVAAQLVSQGLSTAEIAAAVGVDCPRARRLVARVLRKLALRSPRQLSEVWTNGESLAGP